MRQARLRTGFLKHTGVLAAVYVGAAVFSMFAPSSTETAIANGDTRTLNLYHSHTGESIQATFRVNGAYDPAVLAKLNYFLRDWRNNDVTKMDPRLFDVVWEVYRTAGVTEPVRIVSAYRSPETNAMLRSRSSAVAEHSQHILGKAMDTTISSLSMEKIREIGMRLQRGGVGYYGSAAFVHLDVGNVRSWPRMSYDQLARLFPDGKTVHLASNGRTLPRYEEARAEIAARGGIVSDVQVASSGGNFFSWLFGGGREAQDDIAAERAAPPARAQVASLDRADAPAPAAAKLSAADRRKARDIPPAALSAAPAPSAVAAAPAPPPALVAAQSQTVVASLTPPAPIRDSRAGIAEDRAASAPRDSQESRPQESREQDSPAQETRAFAAPPPPRRPADLIAASSLLAEAPLPPPRADGLTKVASVSVRDAAASGHDLKPHDSQPHDAPAHEAQLKPTPAKGDPIGGLIAPAPNASLERAASLPVIITDGQKEKTGASTAVLAYAGGAQPLQKPDPAQKAVSATQPAIVSVRLDKANFHGRASQTASSPSNPVPGQPVTGLRQAAKIIPDALSNKPTSGYVTAFGASASDLDCSHFKTQSVAASSAK
ncbi:DUF882 domain-containing protein [Methylocapsa palsarum]|uniref:Murein endopeptidase K n=1 Tax=Methylocapsa palsarum TaxID=1612308 RepID=A0A1I3YMJ8_9HYPH|nr:DUF882 domain-containing protein [Methylocapsa palsarum]SFK33157.1 Uncharacterized conserved protein YcbK, DUF882 family [Methylocapsa palsarum]